MQSLLNVGGAGYSLSLCHVSESWSQPLRSLLHATEAMMLLAYDVCVPLPPQSRTAAANPLHLRRLEFTAESLSAWKKLQPLSLSLVSCAPSS